MKAVKMQTIKDVESTLKDVKSMLKDVKSTLNEVKSDKERGVQATLKDVNLDS